MKPRWVECADKAAEILETARGERDPGMRDKIINEAHAWMRLADIFRDGSTSEKGAVESAIAALQAEIEHVRGYEEHMGGQRLADLAESLINAIER